MKPIYCIFSVYLFFGLMIFPGVVPAEDFKPRETPVCILSGQALPDIPENRYLSQKADKKSIGWIKAGSSHGITRFEKDMPGTSTKAYKGITVIKSPLKNIYAIISDVATHSRWVRFCRFSRIVKNDSSENTILYYNFDIPWPVANRDIVINTTSDIDPDTGRIIINSIAVSDSDIPVQKGCIRLTDSRQSWILEKITPDSTRVTFISCTPLQGSVPKIFEKIVSKVIPDSTLKTLNKLAVSSHSQYLAKTDLNF